MAWSHARRSWRKSMQKNRTLHAVGAGQPYPSRVVTGDAIPPPHFMRHARADLLEIPDLLAENLSKSAP